MNKALQVVVMLVMTLVLSEVAIRVVNPTPRIQVVTAMRGLEFDTFEGVPLWSDPIGDPRRHLQDCDDDAALQIITAGDSIFYSTEPEAEARLFHTVLMELLADVPGGVCVRNVSQPGYLPYQQFAELRRAHAERPADLAIMGVWKDERRWSLVGEDLYDFDMIQTDDEELPDLGLPSGLNRVLFTNSKLWRFTSLALAKKASSATSVPRDDWSKLADWVVAQDMKGLFVELPTMSQPLSVTADARPERRSPGNKDRPVWWARVEEHVQSVGLEYMVLAEEWRDENYKALRIDACCHYSEKGHAALARELAKKVREMIGVETEVP